MRKLLPVAAVIGVLLLGACSEEKHERGLEAIPDMFHTPAHKPQTALTTADGKSEYSSMLPPPEGTVPRGFTPYALGPTDFEAAKKLVDPLTPSRAVLRAGQTWFNHTCATCHGRDGNAAHGNVAKFFSGIPSIATVNVANMTEGEVYHIVTLGRNRMPDFRAQLPPAERWAVVQYVKLLARATVAAADQAAVVGEAEAAVREHPEDPAAQARMKQGLTLLEQRKADIAAITALGSEREEAAAEFAPLPEPVPEYVPVEWKVPGQEGSGHHEEKHP